MFGKFVFRRISFVACGPFRQVLFRLLHSENVWLQLQPVVTVHRLILRLRIAVVQGKMSMHQASCRACACCHSSIHCQHFHPLFATHISSIPGSTLNYLQHYTLPRSLHFQIMRKSHHMGSVNTAPLPVMI